MDHKGIPIVIVLVAAAAIFWLLGGADLFRSGDDGNGGAGDGGRESLLESGAGDGGGTSADDPSSTGPVLFGRAKEQRVGVGGLAARVMDFSTGALVAGARVVITGTGYGDEKVSARLETDANGRFQFAALAAGDGYSLHLVGGGYQRTLGGVSVDADAVRDLGTIWLGERAGLEGTVYDAEGRGVRGAQVQVHRAGSLLDMLGNLPAMMEQMDRDPVPLAQGETRQGGGFRIEDLDPGPILVVVRAAGHRQKMVKAVMTGEGAAGGPLEIRLEATPVLAGIVVDERGRGIAGARVACMDQSDMEQAFFGRQFTRTDEEGRFRIDSPPAAAKVSVIVAAEGYPTLFTQADAGSRDLRFELVGGAELVLRVLEAGTERVVPNARMMVMVGDEASMGGKKTTYGYAVTDDRGEAILASRPGKVQMVFLHHAERGSGIYSPAMPMGASSILEGPDDPAVKAPRTTLVFHVNQGRTIRGRVADPDGRPIAGARCQAIGAMGIGGTTLTDAEGLYVMGGQSALVQMVVVRAPGYVQEEPGRGGSRKPDARGDLVMDVTMLPAATVTGRVVGPDGRPLAGARVKAGNSIAGLVMNMFGAATESVTNAAGRYVLDGVRPGEKARVLARHAGLLDGQSAAFDVSAGTVNDAPEVTLKRGSKLRVTVTDPAGKPLARARLEVSVNTPPEERVVWDAMSQWRNFADVRTGTDGDVVVEKLPRGEVTLTATADGFAGMRETVSVERLEGDEPTSTEVTVALREAYTLRGRTVDDAGEPVAGVSLATSAPPVAAPDTWIPTRTGKSGADGRFTIPDLPDEALVLHATAEGFKNAQVQVRTPRAEVEVLVVRVSADTQKRLQEIQKELMAIYGQFQGVKDDAERQALLQRMRALQAEQAKLQK